MILRFLENLCAHVLVCSRVSVLRNVSLTRGRVTCMALIKAQVVAASPSGGSYESFCGGRRKNGPKINALNLFSFQKYKRSKELLIRGAFKF